MTAPDELVHVLRPAAGEPAGALVLLHGRGTSEEDLLPLLDALDPDRRLVGAAPRGPLQLPPGGFHWYVVPRVGFPDPATFEASSAQLDRWLAALADHIGVPPAKTILGGFSQGAVMAWALGAGRNRPRPAGILAMSGFIPTVPGFELDPEVLRGLPVAIAHGRLDPIIPVEFGREARDRVEAAGADVLYRESEIPHAVDPRVLPELAAWLPR
jgi:phospholipase/carboxylesterase